MKKTSAKNNIAKKFSFFGFDPFFWLPYLEVQDKNKLQLEPAAKRCDLLIYDDKLNDLRTIERDLLKLGHKKPLAWQMDEINISKSGTYYFISESGHAVVIIQKKSLKQPSHDGAFDFPTAFKVRNCVGAEVSRLREQKAQTINVEFKTSDKHFVTEAINGVILSLYQFFQIKTEKDFFCPKICFSSPCTEEILHEAGILASSVNLARHLVNVPASDLTPKSYSDCLQKNFSNINSKMELEIWDSDKLFSEGCLLHHAVGRGAENGPELIHFRWRPEKSQKTRAVPAIVGKGITFDTGGLDIKSASGMRFMKKDMGGSASVVGLAFWTALSQLPQPADFYIALADNAVDKRSFRPGDIIRSRAGHFVEIHNTDAEGRLVLADAFHVALHKYPEKPSCLINLATLTGAMRAAFGPMVAGFCSNNDPLSEKIYRHGAKVGEWVWRMPLIQEYWSYLKSNTADFSNASDSGFAGAITAGLFLQKFVEEVPWVHFDINCWADKTSGAIAEVGGNGQCVMLLAEFLNCETIS